jgi:hypothetical protein
VRYDVAVLATTIEEREELLQRSYISWMEDADSSGLEVAIAVCSEGFEWSGSVKSFPDRSGSNYRGYNWMVENIDADVYIFTHPEILFPQGTIKRAYDTVISGKRWAGFKVYWVPEKMTSHLDDFQIADMWKEPELYVSDKREKGEPYWNSNVPDMSEWNANTTYAMSEKTTSLLFPMPLFGCWGPDDPYQAAKRVSLGIETVCVMDPILYHQWHPSCGHPDNTEIMDKVMVALAE